MNSVKVKRDELIGKMQANRDAHRTAFETALVVYRKEAIEELDKMIESAKKGDRVRRAIAIPEPEDHTDDYDRVLSMLRMSVDEIIEIQEVQFRMYVLDEWGWARSFGSNTMSYANKVQK